MDAATVAENIATMLLVGVAAVESFRARRAAARGRDAAEPVKEAVAPNDGSPTISARLDGIEREQHETRRAVDRVERDLSTHLQLHSFMGGIRQRFSRDSDPGTGPATLDPPPAAPGGVQERP